MQFGDHTTMATNCQSSFAKHWPNYAERLLFWNLRCLLFLELSITCRNVLRIGLLFCSCSRTNLFRRCVQTETTFKSRITAIFIIAYL